MWQKGQGFLKSKQKALFCYRVKCWWVEEVMAGDVVTRQGKKNETVCLFIQTSRLSNKGPEKV